ncbi:transcription termination factor 2-like isoform X1 [Amblyomma americanum]
MEPPGDCDRKKSDAEARQSERSEAFTRYRDDAHKHIAGKQKVPHAAASLQTRGLDGTSKVSAENVVPLPTKQLPIDKSKEALELEIQKKKKVIGTIKLDTLPDRGKRLKDQLKQLEDQLSLLSLSAPSGKSAGSDDCSVVRQPPTVSTQDRSATDGAAASLAVAEKAVKEVVHSKSVTETSASKEPRKIAPTKSDRGEHRSSKEGHTGRSLSPKGGSRVLKAADGPTTATSGAQSGKKPNSKFSHDLEKNRTDAACSEEQRLSPSKVTLTQRRSQEHVQTGSRSSEHKCASDSTDVAETSLLPKEPSHSKHPEKGVTGGSVVAKRRPVSPVARVGSHHDEPRPPTSALHSVYERRVLLVSPLPLTKTSPPAKGRGSTEEALGTRIPRGLSESCTSRLKHFAQILSSQPGEWDESPQPSGVRTPLMPHQLQALRWMLWREAQEVPGGILADAMGLGKTLTMLTLVEQQRRKDKSWKSATGSKDGGGDDDGDAATTTPSPRGGTLVVCPLSLLHQWEEEVERHLPGQWRVRVHHGRNRSTDPRELVRCHLVITTYDTISSDWARIDATGNKGLSPLFAVRWRRLVLDEAHSIRNLHTRRAKAACALTAWSRWALTGTPVHNDVGDMRALLKFLQCRPFDDDAFWKQWVKENPGPEAMAVVMKCLLLRRTKEQAGKDGKPLVPLPKKNIVLHRLSLEGTEAKVYKELDEWSRSSGPEKYVDPVTGRELYRNTGSRRFVMLIRLQQACSHLALLKRKVLEDAAVDTDELLSASMAGLQLADESAAGEDRLDALNLERYAGAREFDSAYVSCKIKALLDMLVKVQEESNNQDKSVVVSRWTSLLSLVRQQLEKQGIPSVTIQGSVPGQQRAAHVASFNNQEQGGPKVMLLSLEAGGVGLNLIGGNHMFVLDVHWNPALEAQAFDRIHRVGQTKTVVINRLICAGTIEERILELQKHKQRLAESVVGQRRLTADDYAFLFATSS